VVFLPEFLSRILKPIVEFWKGLDKSQRIRIYVTAGIVTVAVGLGLYLLTRPTYTTLIENASSEDIAGMQKVLTDKGISYKLTDDKSGIIVNQTDSDNAHLELVSAGYPKNGLTFADALSNIKINTTESDKKHIWQQLDESDIARQLKLIKNVKDASVTIINPEKTLLIDDTDSKDAKASVVITKDGDITPEQANSIVKLVASSVEGLDAKNVTVVDQDGNTLNTDTENSMNKTSTQYEMKIKVKTDLEQNVKNVLNGQFDSFDTAKVVVNPILDFNTLTQSSKEITNPVGMDSGALISKHEKKENLQNGDSGGTPGVNSNPGTTPTYTTTNSSNAKTYKSSDNTENFDYNRTEKQSEKSLGEVIPEKSSVAITLQYGNRVTDDTKLTADLISQVQKLASSATGIPVANITITKLKVLPPSTVNPTLSETIQSLMSAYGLPLLLLLLVIVMVIVAIPRKGRKAKELEPALAGVDDMISSPKYNFAEIKQEPVPEIDTEERSEVKKQLEKFVKQKPDAVAQLLRNWLTDDYE
jgi:flagellar M-ring protein FliF